MQKRIIKKTGEQLTTLGYGCMRMPCNEDGTINIDLARDQIWSAIDAGVEYVDTAWGYHDQQSQIFLGEHVLKNGYREKVNLATKLPIYNVKKNEDLDYYFNEQLKRLQVEKIDYYLLHALNGSHWDNAVECGVIEFMDKIKREGKIRNMGFSFHGSHKEFIRICDAYDWDFCQVQYNIIDEHYQAGINGIKYASNKGIGVIIMEPLRGGTLTNDIPEKVQAIYDNASIKRTPAEWALRWVLEQEGVTMLLSGMNNFDHIKSNIATCDSALPNSMSAEEKQIISDIRDAYNSLLTVKCTACGYCMPCPAGLDIPRAFKLLNENNIQGGDKFNNMYHEEVKDGKFNFTTACLNCGKCEKACPQFLPIRENLKLVKEAFEK